MYARSAPESRGLSVCSTAPITGMAKYASRCSEWFHPSVATRSPGRTPSRCSALASFCARLWTSPQVVRWIDLSGLRETISVPPKYLPARSNRWERVSG